MKKQLVRALMAVVCLSAGDVYAVQAITLNGFLTTGAVYSGNR